MFETIFNVAFELDRGASHYMFFLLALHRNRWNWKQKGNCLRKENRLLIRWLLVKFFSIALHSREIKIVFVLFSVKKRIKTVVNFLQLSWIWIWSLFHVFLSDKTQCTLFTFKYRTDDGEVGELNIYWTTMSEYLQLSSSLTSDNKWF